MQPIFVFATRSFWWAMAALATFFGGGRPVFEAAAIVVAPVIGIEPDAIADYLTNLSPLVMTLMVLIERRGANRPYTLDPRNLK